MRTLVGNYSHINAVVKFAGAQHAKSSWGDIPFSATLLRKNLSRMVHCDGTDILIVRDAEDKVKGVLLATVDQMVISPTVYAADIHFVCEAGGVQLLAAFKGWAREHGAKFIIMGIGNDDQVGGVARFYRLAGFHQRGDAWVLDLRDAQENVA